MIDSEIDYRALAKFMVASEQNESEYSMKKEVVINEASIKEGILSGYAYDHPKLGEGRINSSAILDITYDERATARVETKNPCLLSFQPAGKFDQKTIHSIIHIQLDKR